MQTLGTTLVLPREASGLARVLVTNGLRWKVGDGSDIKDFLGTILILLGEVFGSVSFTWRSIWLSSSSRSGLRWKVGDE